MTVINSVREIVTMPVTGLTAASQPVIGYNYGAGCYQRVKSAIRFTAVGCIVFTTVVWAVLFLEPRFFLQMFTKEPGNFAVRCFCHADLFLWNLYDGAAVCGTVYSGCVKPCETGRLFFSVSKGHHCHSVDHAASNDRKSGDRWSVLGRTDFQCYWRYGMFCNHVAYNLAKAERRKLLFAVTEKSIIWQKRN